MTIASILWKRLDGPGHDACRLDRTEDGWQLDGAAVFAHENAPARLDYTVGCDGAWHTRWARIRGAIGFHPVELDVDRTPGGTWIVNGTIALEDPACVDLDLGFTPATNLLAIRRLALAAGERAEVASVWLDLPDAAPQVLAQVYERRAGTSYWYESPRFDYAATLDVSPAGFVRRYPGLWEAEHEA
jgi:uncharacterized protein